MSRGMVARARRPSRVVVRRRRTAWRSARLTGLDPRTTDRRTLRAPEGRVRVPAAPRPQDLRSATPFGIELLRTLLLLTMAVLSVVIALPALLAFAAAPFH